jgi:uncharacterized RDD family membrane protein YckC
LFIDLLVIGAVLAIVGIGLAKLTGGQIRVANALINSTSCVPADPVPAGASPPAGFVPTKTLRCTRSFAGLVANDWYLAFVRDPHPGSTATPAETRKVPLDPDGRVASPLYIDGIELVLLLAYLVFGETRSGATAGKKLLGLRVRSLDGGNPSFLQAVKRLLRIVPLAIFTGSVELDIGLLTAIGPFAFLSKLAGYVGIDAGLVLAAGVLIGILCMAIAFLVNFARTTGRGDLPWHDRWAGTEVVHGEASEQMPPIAPETR